MTSFFRQEWVLAAKSSEQYVGGIEFSNNFYCNWSTGKYTILLNNENKTVSSLAKNISVNSDFLLGVRDKSFLDKSGF